jgi:hypothetical protein
MTLEEFESQTRDSLEKSLNHLQTAMLILSSLEVQILESGNAVKDLSIAIEAYITSQQDEGGVSTQLRQ